MRLQRLTLDKSGLPEPEAKAGVKDDKAAAAAIRERFGRRGAFSFVAL